MCRAVKRCKYCTLRWMRIIIYIQMGLVRGATIEIRAILHFIFFLDQIRIFRINEELWKLKSAPSRS